MRRNGLDLTRVSLVWIALAQVVQGSCGVTISQSVQRSVAVPPGDTVTGKCTTGAGLVVALDVVQPQQFYDTMKRVWVFFILMVEKELQIKTLHCVPGKLRLTRQLSAFVLEHSIDA